MDTVEFQQEKKKVDLTNILIFETLGTWIFTYGIFASNGYFVIDENVVVVDENNYPIFQNASIQNLAQALIMGTVMWFSLDLTGSHFNPAVSINMLVRKRICVTRFLYYVFSQMVGAFLGACLFRGCNTFPANPYPTDIKDGVQGKLRQWFGEILATFLLVLFINIQVTQKTQLTKDKGNIGIMFTLFYFTSRSFGYVSGSCLNPAIGLMGELFNGVFYSEWSQMGNVWIYLVGPFIGGVLSAFFFEMVYMARMKLKDRQ